MHIHLQGTLMKELKLKRAWRALSRLSIARVAIIALACAAGGLPLVVQADHPCTNSPGEVRVGTWPGSNGVAPIPICRWVQQPGAAPARVAPPAPPTWEWLNVTYNALATSTEPGVYGLAAGHARQAAADAQALQACRAAGGKACEINAGTRNGCIALAKAPDGSLIWGSSWDGARLGDRDRGELEVGLMTACTKQGGEGGKGTQGRPCELVRTVCERVASTGRALSRQPGAVYGNEQTPGAAAATGPSVHHCGAGRMPVLLRISDKPGAWQQAHCLPNANARDATHPDADDVRVQRRRFETFENRFAAAALDASGPAHGLAAGTTTQEQADTLAIERCRAAGGDRCEVWMRTHNTCMAVAAGPADFRYVLWGFSHSEASRSAVEECSKKVGQACTVLQTVCSYGAYIGLRPEQQPNVRYYQTPPPE
jgi:hypothetical protein